MIPTHSTAGSAASYKDDFTLILSGFSRHLDKQAATVSMNGGKVFDGRMATNQMRTEVEDGDENHQQLNYLKIRREDQHSKDTFQLTPDFASSSCC
jgi:hypothetical protein